jgi:NADH:ubiquinone oxidoreductase subunit F (NADH-binding)
VFQAKGGTKYVVCNGDESEPGTFKDREILLHAPHLVVEAVILAGLILKAQRGYIYIRHEFEEQIESVRAEIRRAEELGVCGQNIFVGTGQPNRSFSVEVFVSPGGYICGEQTALIEAMENKRAEPRNRPPELQTNGLWDCPTLLNNVETFAWVPTIVLRGNGKWFAGRGVSPGRELKGRRFFSISGDVTRPGPYEVPIGIRLRDLIDQYAGGMIAGEPVKAVALSGPSGGFLPRQIPIEFLNSRWVARNLPPETTHFDCLDIELDIQVTRDMGVMLGAGIVIFGDSTDMVAAALSATRFYRNESCGKCVPCRIGSQKLVELLTVVSERKYSMADIYGDSETTCGRKQLIDELAETMKLTSICGLGTVASNPITSLLNYFREDVIRYTTDDVQRFS